MRLHAKFFVLFLGITVLCGSSSWTPYDASGGTNKSEINCGGVAGELGCIWGWESQSNASSIFSHASLGYEWDGEQKDRVVMQEETENDTHYHVWEKEGNGMPDDNTIQVQVSLSSLDGGSSRQRNAADGSWWWTPKLTYEHTAPSVQKKPDGWPNWTDMPWSTVHVNTAPVLAQVQSTDGNGNRHPGLSVTGGIFRASINLDMMVADSKVRIRFPWKVKATADVDNAIVTDWWEAVHYDATSHISGDDHDEDFDLDDLWPLDP